jgi:hypothetical protein
MKSRLALKRLSWSDLSVFEWQFGAVSQRSITLSENVLVDQLFPALGDATRGRRWLPLNLSIFGPGGRGEINLERKIIRNMVSRNWRLGDEVISNPYNDAARFNIIIPGDYAMFLFEGDVIPSSATILFVSSASPEDATLHGALGQFGLSGRDSMRALEEDEIARIIAQIQLPENHPLASFVLTDELQEAAIGSSAAAERLMRRAHAPAVSMEALRRARDQAEEIGRLGEELVAVYLDQLLRAGGLSAFEWVSEINAVAPLDFRISPTGAAAERLDVKTTTGPFERPFHVSFAELKEMAKESEGPYRIYRVYEADESGAKLRISDDLRNFAKAVIGALAVLPPGTAVDAISVDPTGLPFGSAIALAPSDEGDDA